MYCHESWQQIARKSHKPFTTTTALFDGVIDDDTGAYAVDIAFVVAALAAVAATTAACNNNKAIFMHTDIDSSSVLTLL